MASFTEKIDGSYTLQTLNPADTITFSGATANTVVVTIDGDLTVTGNATLLGNISADQIFNGNSNVAINAAGSNVTFGVNGTTNAMVVGNALTTVAGGISAVGNVQGTYLFGNGYFLSGVASGTIGNIGNGTTTISVPVVNGNVIANVGGTGNSMVVASTGVYVGGLVSASGNINTATGVSATGNITGGNVAATNHTGTAVSVTGNVTGGNILVSSSGIISTAGNVTAGNISATNHTGTTVSVTGNATASYFFGNGSQLTGVVATGIGTLASLSVTGNTTTGNLLTGGQTSATGNVIGGNLVTGGMVTATGNIYAGNVTTAGLVSATGNVYSGASLTVYNGAIYSTAAGAGISLVPSDATVGVNITGNITPDTNGTRTIGNATNYYNNVYANTATIAGNVNLTGVSASGNVTAGNLRTGGAITATGNIQGGNILTGGLISATSNITGGNVLFGSGMVTGTGNVYAGNVLTSLISGTGTVIKSTGAINLQPTGNVVLTANTYINNLADPVQSQDAASKAYVDSVAQGLDVKASVAYATAAALSAYTYNNGTSGVGATITANAVGALSVDGSTPAVSDRILVKSETTTNAPYNGIYTVTVIGNASAAFQLTRSTDFDGTSEMAGAFTFVEGGSTLADTGWVCTTNNPITLGTTNITFAQFSGAGTYTAGTGLTLSGTTFSVNASQTQITAVGTLGSLSVTANTTSGNLITGGLVSATGNITAVANVAGGNILTAGIMSSTGNAIHGNVQTAGLITATGNITAVANIAGGNILTAGLISATGNVTGGNLNAAGLSLSGNVVGNLNITGNVQGGNLKTAGLISATGNITTSGFFIGDGSQISNASFAGTQIVSGTTNWSISAAGGNIVGTIGGTANVVVISTAGISTTGNVTAGNTVGTHVGAVQFGSNTVSGTGNVTGGNLLSSALVQGTTLSASGNVIGGNLNAAGLSLSSNVISALNSTANITTTANVAGGNLIGTHVGNLTGTTVSVTGNINGGNLIGTIVGNVTGTTVSVTGNITGGNLNAAGLSLSSNVVSALNVTSNITGGNIASVAQLQAANLIISGNVTSPSWTTAGVAIKTVPSTYTDSSTLASGTAVTNHINVLGQPTLAGANLTQTTTSAATLYVVGAPIAGANMTITNPYAIYVASGNVVAVANITGGNLLTSGLISSTGNITGGNLNAAGLSLSSNVVSALNSTSGITTTANITGGNILFGSGVVSGTGTITAGAITANLSGASISVSGGVTAASVAGGVMTGTSISLTGAITGTTITGTSLNVSAGVVNLGSITNASANGVGNIGNSTGYFNTLFATATKALYADLAESYAADASYAPGTVVSFGGSREVTLSTVDADRKVAGVITTAPSYHMNAGLSAPHIAVIALQGRVPAKVVGTVRKGDMMVSAGNGAARADDDPRTGTIIGKALEDFDGESGVIEIAVGRI
jgi:filamentous hemagglutinin